VSLGDGVAQVAGTVAGLLPRRLTSPEPRAWRPAEVVLHGASAGEVKAARAVLSLRGLTSSRVLLTTGTSAGIHAGADTRLPRDVPRDVSDFLDAVCPRALVLVEGELWPTLLRAASRRGIPVGVLGARVSERTVRTHAALGGATRTWFSRPEAWAAATEGDAARLLRLGVRPDRVRVTGWLKWPEPVAVTPDPVAEALVRDHRATGPLFVLGSVHPGEVRLALAALRGTVLDPARSRWVVVPRHPRRASRIRRELPPGAVIDARFGVLRAWYAQADAALVGGGARGRATHDLLEPLQGGLRPLFFASADQDDVASILLGEGLAIPVGSPPSLTRAPHAWADLRARFDGRAAGLAFLSARGVGLP